MRILANGFHGIKRNYVVERKAPNKITVIKACIFAASLAAVIGIIWGRSEKTMFTSAGVGDNSCTTVNGRELPIYCVETDENVVAISFDAAWGNEDTEEILAVLKKNNVKATFFMTGGWVENYPEDVKKILEAGHDLANHSENHKNMSQLSDSECQEELMKVHNKVKELTGYEMYLFRPPYGDYDNEVISNASSCGYYTVQWSIDSLDWKNYGVNDIIERVCEHDALKPGAIILCHNGADYTAEALDDLIKGVKEKGYEFVPISELIYKNNYYMKADGTQVSTLQNEPTSLQ